MSEDKKTKAFHIIPPWVMIELPGPEIACWRCGEREDLKLPRPAAEVSRLMERFAAAHRGCLEG